MDEGPREGPEWRSRTPGSGSAVVEASPGCSVAGGPSGDQGGKESLWHEVSEGHFIPRHGGCVHSQLLHNERTPDGVGVPMEVSSKARWRAGGLGGGNP